MSNLLLLLLLQACPSGNLTLGKPADGTGFRGYPSVITDGLLAPEGSNWESPVAVALNKGEGQITIDLGQVVPVRALVLQGDNNDFYHVEASPDAVTWREIWVAPPHPDDQGLRTRFAQLPRPQDARYLRVYGTGGDGWYSVSELRAYCELPQPWPPALVITPAESWWNPFNWWRQINNPSMVGIKGAIALLGGLLLVWTIVLRILGQPDRDRRVRDRMLMVLGAFSFLCWWNLGHFHFQNYVHIWEHYHYYMGSKYFRELGYTRLYQCTVIADSEMGRTHEKVRNLLTNELERADATLADPSVCKRHFSDARWQRRGGPRGSRTRGSPPTSACRPSRSRGARVCARWPRVSLA